MLETVLELKYMKSDKNKTRTKVIKGLGSKISLLPIISLESSTLFNIFQSFILIYKILTVYVFNTSLHF